MNRKKFISQGGLLGVAAFTTPSMFTQTDTTFDLEQIKELVFAAHNDFDKTKTILDKNPLLLNCANQPQKGDFETSMGAAAHMGRTDIADLLVQKGARLDIFSLTFLGHVDFVKQFISLSPQYLKAPGPHGFSLLHHARMGKHSDFEKWLIDQGLEDDRFDNVFG